MNWESFFSDTESGDSDSYYFSDSEPSLYRESLREHSDDGEVHQVLSAILNDALQARNDECPRQISSSASHRLYVFTNCRVVQVYCFHGLIENHLLNALAYTDREYLKAKQANKLHGETYEDFTKENFKAVRPYLAWECVFPEGIDMEALSPRDANAQVKVKQTAQKTKAVPAQALKREKDHPPPPPSEVHEPPSSDRKDGAVYHTGRCLGKGGFAICYEGQLAGTKQTFALKIVKSQMPQKKMEQKFQTELQIHSKMRHPNIVQFHRAFTFQQSTYIVLELCPNGSLMDMVKKRRFLTEPEVRFYTIQMAGAIKYMHAKGIIHRDLKMGNIFLDKDMNIKVGDFGLAALLMSGKDMSACRRTTLCGTPNYIAPEILEKSKKGHDHAVDIWSLGIIIFAMLTGRPPFQSTTQEEIYRKAREREYDWPKLNTSENSICQEAKDLVSILLQTAEDRPGPDTIVQHQFFSCGWVPSQEEMTPKLRDSAPGPNQFLAPGLRAGRVNGLTRNLRKLCVQSEVGSFAPSPKQHSSTYREVAAEEKAGLTPAVPLPDNVVYRPFDEWLKEQIEKRKFESNSTSGTANQVDFAQALPIHATARLASTAARSGQQSFAAQQRAQYQPPPAAVTSTGFAPKSRPDSQENKTDQNSRLQTEKSKNGKSNLQMPTKPTKLHSNVQENDMPKDMVTTEGRIGADLVQQLNQAGKDRKSSEGSRQIISKHPLSLFSEEEHLELLPHSRPDQVLDNLRKFHAELKRALNSRSIVSYSCPPENSSAIVVKWVDYTNKFGLGYILSDGSVGCIFKSSLASSGSVTGRIPPTCVIVRDAERHLQSRGKESYADRHQLVPVSGPPIEFYENRLEEGISRVNVSPRKFAVTLGKEGEPGRLSRGKSEYDDRKCEKIVLWNKFAKYMTAFGRDQDYPYDDALQRTPNKSESGTVVTFYQRFGDVGCWGFRDGCFQFNFPDHTKMVLSADATWCDFYHLPLEAARDLAQTGILSAAALDDRQHLSYPLQTLLNFLAKPPRSASHAKLVFPIDPMVQGIPQANDFRKKVEFIKDIVGEWIRNGGLGNSNMEPIGRLRWAGHREKVNVKVPYKHVWVTVGARSGDNRRVAWFDPSKPHEIGPDIEA